MATIRHYCLCWAILPTEERRTKVVDVINYIHEVFKENGVKLFDRELLWIESGLKSLCAQYVGLQATKQTFDRLEKEFNHHVKREFEIRRCEKIPAFMLKYSDTYNMVSWVGFMWPDWITFNEK